MLLIDCHEPITIIKKLESIIPTKVLALKYGDYSFSDIIIERKTLSDFFCSIKNSRLEEQMESTSRLYTENYLLIEGFFDFSYVNNISYLYAKLESIVLDFDTKIIFSIDSDSTVLIIKKLFLKKNFGYIKNSTKKDKFYHTAKLFDINNKKLNAIFLKFGSIKNIANADTKEITKINSIGKKTVEKVKNALESDILN